MVTYSEVENTIERMIRNPSMSLGLERTESLLTALGNPQKAYGGVLVAGTNGKGSTCAMLSAMLSACGKHVGSNPSPELTDIRDRFLLDSRPVPAPVLADAALHVNQALASTELECSEFEIITAIAFEAFRLLHCDAVVAEVGLGGRWDSTNVYRPRTKIITGIDFDHMEFLGPDLWSIAREKSGIIYHDDIVVIPTLPGEALRAIESRVDEVSARLLTAPDHITVTAQHTDWSGQQISIEDDTLGAFTARLPLLGNHQLSNLSVALCALHSIDEDLGVGVTQETVVNGLNDVKIPGRLEVIQWNDSGAPRLLIDIAHNVQAMQTTVDIVKSLHSGPVILLFGCYGDKDVAGMLATVPEEWRCVFTKAPAQRGLHAEKLAAIAQEKMLKVEFFDNDLTTCLDVARRIGGSDSLILATGSSSTAGYVRRLATGG